MIYVESELYDVQEEIENSDEGKYSSLPSFFPHLLLISSSCLVLNNILLVFHIFAHIFHPLCGAIGQNAYPLIQKKMVKPTTRTISIPQKNPN